MDRQSMRKCSGNYRIFKDGKYQFPSFENAYFHCWGQNYDEYDAGPGNQTVAVVELENGQVVSATFDSIVFLS